MLRKLYIALALIAVTQIASTGAGKGVTDWHMWGGSPDRNMVSQMKGVPATWDIAKKTNIKWIGQLGSQAYGNPVVGSGVVLVGTNNEANRDPKIKGDKGVLMAFREKDGEFLYQVVSDKLPVGRVNDWPYQGVASSPAVEGERLYYVSNRGVVTCLDIQGFRDNENDGPFKDEKFVGQADADVIFVSMYRDADGKSEDAAQPFLTNPLWGNLRGRKIDVDDSLWMTPVSIQGAHMILDDLAEAFGVDPHKG